MPIPKNEKYNRQVWADSRDADGFSICKINRNKIVLAISCLGEAKVNGCDLISKQYLLVEEIAKYDGVALNGHGLRRCKRRTNKNKPYD